MENTRIEGDAARVKQNVAREKTTYLVLTSTAPYYTIYYNSAGTAYELYGVKQYHFCLAWCTSISPTRAMYMVS